MIRMRRWAERCKPGSWLLKVVPKNLQHNNCREKLILRFLSFSADCHHIKCFLNNIKIFCCSVVLYICNTLCFFIQTKVSHYIIKPQKFGNYSIKIITFSSGHYKINFIPTPYHLWSEKFIVSNCVMISIKILLQTIQIVTLCRYSFLCNLLETQLH